MSRAWWVIIRWLARLCVWAYYRSFRTEHAERIPRTGPVLFVLNHPNALMDAAVLLRAVPRPVSLAAKSTLFRVPVLGWLLRKLGAVPVYRPRDRTGDARKNLGMFDAFTEHFAGGGAAGIFPEGHSHLDPELKEVKSGPARIALAAEQEADFKLGLRIIAIGLHYEPRQQFRGEVHVRVGEPFGIEDLRDRPRREAIRTVQDRIRGALRPLVLHLDRVDLEPLVRDVADVYDEYQRIEGKGMVPRPKADIVRLAGVCLNHFLVADPTAVTTTRRKLRRYRRLERRAGIGVRALAQRASRWRAWTSLLWTTLRLVLGLPIYAFGVLTSFTPFRATGRLAVHYASRQGRVSLPTLRVVVGAVVFGIAWGALTFCVWLWSDSVSISLAFLAAVAASAFYARYYASRVRGWWARIDAMLAGMKPGIRRVTRAREDLLGFVNELVRRFHAETGLTLLPARKLPWYRRVPWRLSATLVFVAVFIWFAWGLKDVEVAEMTDRPSPWGTLSPERARETLQNDAVALLSLLGALEELEARSDALVEEFGAGQRRFTDVADDRAIRQTLLTYLTCRSGLFRLAWFYRRPERVEADPELAEAAFILGYAAALELVGRGMQFVEEFEDDPNAIRKLNEGDSSCGLPPDVYNRVRRNLANSSVYEELANGTARFQTLAAEGPWPGDPVFGAVMQAARERGDVVARLSENRLGYKWDAAVARAATALEDGRYVTATCIADLIGRVHVRGGDLAKGLISDDQVVWMRAELLQPGDILLERRNWALSNVFLPGYWTHAAMYVGGPEELAKLGITADPRVSAHRESHAQPDDHGDDRVVIEALGPGVVLNSLETSAGGADGVCVLRPVLPPEEIGRAVARAFAHLGKPYDFDFDFFSTDRLVCTELIHQAYDEALDFQLVTVMGRETLPAIDILRRWTEERNSDAPTLRFVCFLDAVEDERTAKVRTEEDLISTLDRPGIDILQTHAGTTRSPRSLLLILGGLTLLGLLFLRRR